MSFAGVFLTLSWRIMWPMSGKQTQRHALREDPGRAVTDIAVLTASFASLGAVAVLLMSADFNKDLAAALSVSSVALSWAAVHTVFSMRYARLDFEPPLGGVDFNEKNATDGMGNVPLRYREFVYVAFTVGMTFQISNTNPRPAPSATPCSSTCPCRTSLVPWSSPAPSTSLRVWRSSTPAEPAASGPWSLG